MLFSYNKLLGLKLLKSQLTILESWESKLNSRSIFRNSKKCRRKIKKS